MICVNKPDIINSSQWRHNGRDSVSNHQPHHCLLNGLFRRRWKKTSKLRVTGLWAGNSPVSGEFPAQMASNAENVSIWLRHHVIYVYITGDPLHSRAACTQPCNVNTHSRAHCSPGARLCEQWGHGCVNNGARLCASARLCRGSPVYMRAREYVAAVCGYACGRECACIIYNVRVLYGNTWGGSGGVLSQFPPFPYFPNFSELSKY